MSQDYHHDGYKLYTERKFLAYPIAIPIFWERLCLALRRQKMYVLSTRKLLEEHQFLLILAPMIKFFIKYAVFCIPMVLVGFFVDHFNWLVFGAIASIIQLVENKLAHNYFSRSKYTDNAIDSKNDEDNEQYEIIAGCEKNFLKARKKSLQKNPDYIYRICLKTMETWIRGFIIIGGILPYAILMYAHPEEYRIIGITGLISITICIFAWDSIIPRVKNNSLWKNFQDYYGDSRN